jgi:hypothetical protein
MSKIKTPANLGSGKHLLLLMVLYMCPQMVQRTDKQAPSGVSHKGINLTGKWSPDG